MALYDLASFDFIGTVLFYGKIKLSLTYPDKQQGWYRDFILNCSYGHLVEFI